MTGFEHGSVWFLLLLALVPLAWWRYFSPSRRTPLRFSTVRLLREPHPTWAVRGRHMVPALRTAALVLLIICLARPQKGNEETRVFAESLAIQLIVDRSGSMQAMDFQVDGKPVDRLTAVKKVVKEFVFGDRKLAGRPDDLIGLIVFGTFADSLCPLTLDHDHLIKSLDTAQIAGNNQEGATAIGDAIALGVERLRTLEQQRGYDDAMKIKSKIMILLTDGENTAGDIEPLQGAEMAAAFDIKIYTIGAGTQGMAPMPTRDIFGRQIMQPMPVTIDEDTLREIARLTGGQYFRATDTDSLQNVYARIDELEKTRVEERRYLQETELATASVQWGPLRLPPLLLIVLIMLVAELLLSSTRFRTIP